MQKYYAHTMLEVDHPAVTERDRDWYQCYESKDVEAALAAKDAQIAAKDVRIAELEFRLRTVLELQQTKVEAHPDTARLDWLNGNCVICPTEDGQRWVFNTPSHVENECLRTAVDNATEPTETPRRE